MGDRSRALWLCHRLKLHLEPQHQLLLEAQGPQGLVGTAVVLTDIETGHTKGLLKDLLPEDMQAEHMTIGDMTEAVMVAAIASLSEAMTGVAIRQQSTTGAMTEDILLPHTGEEAKVHQTCP